MIITLKSDVMYYDKVIQVFYWFLIQFLNI